MSNAVDAEGPFLKNTWRFQALFFVAIFMIPFFFLYDRYYLKYERYRAYLRELEEKKIKAKVSSVVDPEKKDSEQPKSYEEKYPRPTDESKGEDLYIFKPEEANSEKFKQFEILDKDHFRRTFHQTIHSFNESVNLASQTNLALFNVEKKVGNRTFNRHLYFMTFLAACFYVIWSYFMVWGSLNTI